MEVDTKNKLQLKIDELEEQLQEAQQLIDAIREGEVDAFAINKNDISEVYTLQSGDYAYRALIEKFGEGALNLTEDGLMVYCNTYFSELIQVPYDQIVGHYLADLVADGSKDGFYELLTSALTGSSKGEIDLFVNGIHIPVYISLASLQPRLATVGIIITDLTEKKRNEAVLEGMNRMLSNKNKELEQQILNEFSESFASYKSGDDFFQALTGELAEKTRLDYVLIGEVFHAEDPSCRMVRTFALASFGALTDNIQYSMSGGPCEQIMRGALYSYPSGCRTRFPDSIALNEYQVEGYIGYPLFDSGDQVIGLIAVMHRSEIKYVEYIQSLLRIAARRTEGELERLRGEKLLAAKNVELERQNAELASFSYIASHDLQEPLRKIQAFSSRIMEKELSLLSDTARDYFGRITGAAARMQNLIEDLLSYSRTNTSEMVFTSCDLNKILEEVKSDLRDTIVEKDVLVASTPLPSLLIFPTQFHQLLLNLLTNAIKYSKAGVPPVIRITAELVSEKAITAEGVIPKSAYWKISVADNGIGFDQQHAHRIFDLFQRLHGRSEYEGTGIGLAICKKIVQNHHGYIMATGQPGVGSIFDIFFPIKKLHDRP